MPSVTEESRTSRVGPALRAVQHDAVRRWTPRTSRATVAWVCARGAARSTPPRRGWPRGCRPARHRPATIGSHPRRCARSRTARARNAAAIHASAARGSRTSVISANPATSTAHAMSRAATGPGAEAPRPARNAAENASSTAAACASRSSATTRCGAWPGMRTVCQVSTARAVTSVPAPANNARPASEPIAERHAPAPDRDERSRVANARRARPA